ncbi:Cytochrome c oxidase subunit VIIa [Musa troglodytarum]|uniref:Cytochrome c oxidase subunit VIIa n=1 Tax=Musa troglodytarum TaxID=320322 RepID=A0A9E7KYJ3_9LILI|nr:Cytochrome c oxidase subunit VIIa [Musa troglodytarum]
MASEVQLRILVATELVEESYEDVLVVVGGTSFSMTEPPFVSRERLMKHQQYFQHIHKHTYLKGRFDKITSVAIPLALTVTSLALIGRGIYNMSHGIGKKA